MKLSVMALCAKSLQEQIVAAQLESFVALRGSLSQAQVFEALQRSDIFALASIVDGSGASDVFPTVIQEAMACATSCCLHSPRRDSGNSC